MSNEKQPAKDPVLASENAKRAEKIDEKNAREIARIENEAREGTSEAKKRLLAQMEAEETGGNLTEKVLREHMSGHFVHHLNMDPDKARDLARLRAAQMVGKET